MKRKLYYTVDIEFYDGNVEMGPTGHKQVNVYEAIDNEIKPLVLGIDADLSDVSIEVIQNWLEDNGFGDVYYETIAL